jgi:uncharacterized protein (DUF488 family)
VNAVQTIWTIGHSTREAATFTDVLQAYGIELVVDVRRYPGSRRLPQFTSDALAATLANARGASSDAGGIAYHWVPQLGGRRRPSPESVNVGWRHPAFRAYADHVASEEFAEGLFELLMLAPALRTAIMCSEVLWWRCHRRIIADVLTSLGIEVIHIRDAAHADVHRLLAPAVFVNDRLSYDVADITD